MALCGAKCVDLANFSIKILGVHYSYNKQVQNDQNFLNHISKIESVLKIWRMRNLTIQGKITVFKTLAISKIVHLSLVTEVPNAIVLELNKIQNDFIWNGNKPKIKHSTLCDTYDKGGLKNVNIQFKITSLQCSWIMRLYDKSDHCWKIIPLYLINNKLGKNFSFHSNLNISSKKLAAFPLYYQQIFQKWCTYLSSSPTLPSAIASQCLWYNSLILIEGKSIYNSRLSERNLNYIWQMFKNNGELKSWNIIKNEFSLHENQKFTLMQISDAIPRSWKHTLITNVENIDNLVIHDHHLLKKNQILCLSKLSSKEIYSILLLKNESKPTSQIYFEKLLNLTNINWKDIYLLPRFVAVDTRIRIFQYKIINNVLYLNKMLFKFGKAESPLCTFCKANDETPLHLFYECAQTQTLFSNLLSLLREKISVPRVTPQSAMLGITDKIENSILINHIILIFKYYVYNARKSGYLNICLLKNSIFNVMETERNLCKDDPKKLRNFRRKWRPMNGTFNEI